MRRKRDEDFNVPKQHIYGSPFRPTVAPDGTLIPAIVPVDLSPPVPRSKQRPITFCKAGHALTGANVIYVISANRNRLKRCRACADAAIRWVPVPGGFEVYDGRTLLGVVGSNQVRR